MHGPLGQSQHAVFHLSKRRSTLQKLSQRMDFVSDSLANGRRLKCLTVADDFSQEAVDIAVDYGISGQCVIRLLDQAAQFRGYPAAVQTDNGPEFTSRAFIGWAQSHGIDTS